MRNALIVALVAITVPATTTTDAVRVAVASNFVAAAHDLSVQFEAQTGHRVVLIPGSTGKHAAQIRAGAPFDVFLAADTERPAQLERDGLIVAGSRFTYALGRLVLWSARAGYVDNNGDVLLHGGFRHIAIANPALAPYGRAAEEVLKSRGILDACADRIIRGENVAQTYQFIASGNAELGFVARSQIARDNGAEPGSTWEVPATLHSPIRQQAVQLRDTEAPRAFMLFLHSDDAMTIIRRHGYDTP